MASAASRFRASFPDRSCADIARRETGPQRRRTGRASQGFACNGKHLRSHRRNRSSKKTACTAIARELGESEGPLVIAGASIVQTNSVDALIAAHFVNLLLGNVGRPGGVLAPSSSALAGPKTANVPDALKDAQVLLLDGANPVYTLPSASGVTSGLAHLDTIASFGMFVDDSVAYADAILPSHHPLESEIAIVPAVATTPVSINVAVPFVQPLHDTRPLEQVLDASHAK